VQWMPPQPAPQSGTLTQYLPNEHGWACKTLLPYGSYSNNLEKIETIRDDG